MLKIAGGIVLGFFGIIICCLMLHECSVTTIQTKHYLKKENVFWANECKELILLRLKNPENFTFHIDSVLHLNEDNMSYVAITLYNKENANEIGSVGCEVIQTGDNEFKSKIQTELYTGNIEK